MAIKLVLEFKDAEGSSRKWSFNYAKEDMTVTTVKNLADAMITNGSIFTHPPVSIANAKKVVTTETNYNVTNG